MINMYIFWNYLYFPLISSIQSGLRRLEDFPMPFWLALFVEGTRFTQTKLAAAQDYAASRGMPVPRNVLIPRTKVNFIWIISNKFNLYEIPSYIDYLIVLIKIWMLLLIGFCFSSKSYAVICSSNLWLYTSHSQESAFTYNVENVWRTNFCGRPTQPHIYKCLFLVGTFCL